MKRKCIKKDSYYKEDYPIDLLNGYQDTDGYAARTLYSGGAPASLSLIDADTIRVGYFSAPRTFKILLIIDEDILIISKVMDRRMFTSQMTFDLTGVDLTTSKSNVGTISEHIPLLEFSGKYILRVLLTIGIELLVLLAFMYKNKKGFYLCRYRQFCNTVWINGCYDVGILFLGGRSWLIHNTSFR